MENTGPSKAEALLIGLISMMNPGRGTDWTTQTAPTLARMYLLPIRAMGEAIAQEVVNRAILIDEWRPSPARLREIAKEIVIERTQSALPSVDEVYIEITEKAQRLGIYGKEDPKNPNVHYPGDPTFTHDIVKHCVSACGGWQSICSGEANLSEGLRKQVNGAYARAVTRIEEQAAEAVIPIGGKREAGLIGV